MNKEERFGQGMHSASRRTVNGRNTQGLSAISVSSEQRVRLIMCFYSSCIIIEFFTVKLLFETTKISLHSKPSFDKIISRHKQ
jgi:hypothetical protein